MHPREDGSTLKKYYNHVVRWDPWHSLSGITTTDEDKQAEAIRLDGPTAGGAALYGTDRHFAEFFINHQPFRPLRAIAQSVLTRIPTALHRST